MRTVGSIGHRTIHWGGIQLIGARMPERMEEWKREWIGLLYGERLAITSIAAAVGCHRNMVHKLLRQRRVWRPRRGALRLSVSEREEISRGLLAGESRRTIATRLNRAPSTISREVAAHGTRRYRAWRGEERAARLSARPRPGKIESNPALQREVEAGLLKNWSPEQIARRLRDQFPHTPRMRVSHETIYRALYIQGRGSLRKELARHLRTKRSKRRTRARENLRGKIRDMVMISQRPPEVEDRAVPGHWEGDLIMGRRNKSAIGTLVERRTRFVMLMKLSRGKNAECVRAALTKKITKLPKELQRSLTWDQGTELSQHAEFTVDTGVQVYFCDPHSPWQRGSNENTNGLLRQYFPKNDDLNRHSQAELDRVARQLNGRPRQTLGWKTPSEVLNELLR